MILPFQTALGPRALFVGLALGLTGCSLLGAGGSLFGGNGDTGGATDPEAVVPADAPTGTCASSLDEEALEAQMALFVAIRETVQDVGSSAAAEHDARNRLADLPKNLADLVLKADAAIEQDNLGYAVKLFISVLKVEPGFVDGRKKLRAAAMKISDIAVMAKENHFLGR